MANNILKGKRGIIFGALDENSIAWKTALKVKEEGGTFTLTNAPIAMRLGKINELAKACDAQVIPADATSEDDLKNLFTKSIEVLGGKIDFVLHSIGMSPNIRKGKEYGDMNYEWYLKTLDISALSFHKVMQTAEKLDAMNEWGDTHRQFLETVIRQNPKIRDTAKSACLNYQMAIDNRSDKT